MKASDIMTTDIVTITPDTGIYECLNVMQNKQIRRVLVVDKNNRCVEIVAQADLAEHSLLRDKLLQSIKRSRALESELLLFDVPMRC